MHLNSRQHFHRANMTGEMTFWETPPSHRASSGIVHWPQQNDRESPEPPPSAPGLCCLLITQCNYCLPKCPKSFNPNWVCVSSVRLTSPSERSFLRQPRHGHLEEEFGGLQERLVHTGHAAPHHTPAELVTTHAMFWEQSDRKQHYKQEHRWSVIHLGAVNFMKVVVSTKYCVNELSC